MRVRGRVGRMGSGGRQGAGRRAVVAQPVEAGAVHDGHAARRRAERRGGGPSLPDLADPIRVQSHRPQDLRFEGAGGRHHDGRGPPFEGAIVGEFDVDRFSRRRPPSGRRASRRPTSTRDPVSARRGAGEARARPSAGPRRASVAARSGSRRAWARRGVVRWSGDRAAGTADAPAPPRRTRSEAVGSRALISTGCVRAANGSAVGPRCIAEDIAVGAGQGQARHVAPV